MRLTAILLLAACMQVSAKNGSGQITLSEHNTPFSKVLEKIQTQSGYDFVSTYETMRDAGNVTVTVKNVSLKEALDACLDQKPLTYTIIGKTVVLKVKPFELLQDQMQASTVGMLVFPQTEIRGKVTDENGNALPGVSVTLKSNPTIGTTTNEKGEYSLSLENTNGALVFTSVGHTSQEVSINGRSTVNVVLQSSTSSLEDVVVIGYGTQKKSDLTGAVSAIQSKDFNKGVNSSVDDLLKGKAAGVQVVQNSSEPGGGVSISIRGASSINAGTGPLFVIDGLPIDNSPSVTGSGTEISSRSPRNPMNSINPSDIASIEILKDASAAAIYGSRGANGVILITTKKGSNAATRINYNDNFGIQNVAKTIKVLTPEQYKEVLNDLISDGAASIDNQVGDIADVSMNWQDEIFQKNALMQNHNISLSGGNDKNSYYTSLSYFGQDGIVKKSSFDRYSARINYENHSFEKLELGLNLNTSYSINNYAPIGFGINGESGVIYTALNFDPTLPVFDKNGAYSLSPFLDMDNPLALINGIISSGNIYRTYGTVYGKYNLLPNLSAKINLGGDILTERKDSYTSMITRHGAPQGGIASILQGQKSNYLIEGTISYNKDFHEHHLDAVGGITTQKFINNNTNMGVGQFPSDVTGTYNLGLGTQSTYSVGSGKTTNSLLSYLGRVNYQFQNKYLLTASFRADGSSRFGINNQFGFFPSFAVAWKINEENFLKDNTSINILKIRGSWGQTGNQEIGDYAAITTFVGSATAILDEKPVPSTAPARLANPDLKWETTAQTDIGVDFGFLNNRVSGSIDFYSKKTFNMLLNLPVPTSTGFASQLSNIGSIKNQGWEITLNTRNVEGVFGWGTNIIISTMKNKVLDLGPVDQIITGNAGQTSDIFLIKPGQTLFSFYGYSVLGVWQKEDDFSVTTDAVQPGDLKFEDINGDHTVNADDRTTLGSSFPKFIWSFGNSFSFKNIQLDIFLEGNHGAKMLNNNLVDVYFPVQFRRNRFAEPYLNRWTNDQPSDKYPSFVNPTGQGSKLVNSRTVEDASYVRVKSISVTYDFHLKDKFIRGLKAFISAENLFTFSNYSGFDPSVNPNGNVFQRIDFNAYPLSRTVMGGVSVDF